MCTAISLKTENHYFGRNLDLDRSFCEEICVLPRRYPLAMRNGQNFLQHYAIIGMCTVIDGFPLLYDGANEHGLAMAGLNFPGNACYAPFKNGLNNIAPFEFIPYVLAVCKNTEEVEALLVDISLYDIPFSSQVPNTPLHFIICDRSRAITVEAMADGIHVYENEAGVLTNNPPFPYQIRNFERYKGLRNDNKTVKRETGGSYESYCQGLGAVGLPGDVSSMSRFVRAAYLRQNSVCKPDEESSVVQFFHLLSAVEMVMGACKNDAGFFDFTVYSSCINTAKGRYYYTTYGNRSISCVDMHGCDLDGETLCRFSLKKQDRPN